MVIYSILNNKERGGGRRKGEGGRKREKEGEGGGEERGGDTHTENMLDFINLGLAHKNLVFRFFINCKTNPKTSHKNFVAESLKMLSRRKM